jgi:hypothetical protein
MKKGILIFAHNSKFVDYALMAIISAKLAKKQLNVPASLATDAETVRWMKSSNIFKLAQTVFEKIIVTPVHNTENSRVLHDGLSNETIPFKNSSRSTAWELTPYDRTLLIDSDYLIFSNNLTKFWNVDQSVMLGDSIKDIYNIERLGYHDKYISDVGIKLYWATTVMFSKDHESKVFFDTVDYIKKNYQTYADIFQFNGKQYRNDIAFSIAKHILDGFEQTEKINLPPVLTLLDKDILHSVDDTKLTCLFSPKLDSDYSVASISDTDIHVMNKQSIIRNKENLLGVI